MSRQRFRHAAPRRRINSVVLVVGMLLVLVLVAVVVTRCGDRPEPAEPTYEHEVVAVDPQDLSAAATPEQAAVDLVWPTDLTWVTVAGLDLPASATAGPRDLAGGQARRFGRTPAGAVLAALHLLVRTSPQVGPRVWEPTLREQVVGPDVTAYVDAVVQDYETARERLQLSAGEPLGRIYASIGGVRIDAFTPQAASLRVLIEAPGGDGSIARAATVVQVAWSGTDWKLIAPPRGDWASVRVLIPAGLVRAYTPLPRR